MEPKTWPSSRTSVAGQKMTSVSLGSPSLELFPSSQRQLDLRNRSDQGLATVAGVVPTAEGISL